MPPDPIIEPMLVSVSYSIGKSKYSIGIHPPEGPPVCTALSSLLSVNPPPISYIMSLKGIPIGTSTSPTLFIFPANAKTFVPVDFFAPILLYQLAPLLIIWQIFAKVSTLLTQVGFCHNPFSEVLGGFIVGSPLWPSMECIKAVASPHTKAPAPYLISISKLKPVFNIFSPSTPISLAWAIATFNLCTAKGYSALI